MNVRFCSPGRILPYLFYFSLLYLLLWCWKPVRAQSTVNYKPLQIGDTVPDVVIKNILHYKTPTARLSDFKGKLLIVDFWATWCAPCVYMIPRMDSLQKQFEGRVQFLAVTSENEKAVANFRTKYLKRHPKRIEHPEVAGDSVLRRLFYHNALPHYVWIDQTGVVGAVTEMAQITSENISAFLAKNSTELKEKKDEKRIAYDGTRPFLVDGNGGDGSSLLYHSLLSRYTPGLKRGFSYRPDEKLGRRITVTNCSRLWLYKIAYAKPGQWFDEANVVIESADSNSLTTELHGQNYIDWLKDDNGFCYELIVPAAIQDKTNALMQQDLINLFPQYKAKVENRMKRGLALIRLENTPNLLPASQGGKREMKIDRFGWEIKNATLTSVLERFNKTQSFSLPLMDQTGIKTPVDLSISVDMSDLAATNTELSRYGLKLIEKQFELPVLVIADNKKPTAH
ncbi:MULTISPECIES: TlpA family protein disulfide reductase [Dyadobacter]|jgi:thiol-disulfide isomerase/thioredoxin|uniref:TlpA family protein disulfide reductase n=1 Tax=Dyadobacter psychrotolerans TaxID=2541721 RepID=A0A4R5DMA0_9BACT|nr:TlpA disulfide reductase family protein [Dyadobacter psychrotolerans]TDE13214.1 TlpA family protein disulfide reductase [Dyadobacter psychrotolerans]